MKTKALISWVVTAQLICSFVFAYAKSRFSFKVKKYKKTSRATSALDTSVVLESVLLSVLYICLVFCIHSNQSKISVFFFFFFYCGLTSR